MMPVRIANQRIEHQVASQVGQNSFVNWFRRKQFADRLLDIFQGVVRLMKFFRPVISKYDAGQDFVPMNQGLAFFGMQKRERGTPATTFEFREFGSCRRYVEYVGERGCGLLGPVLAA